MIGLYRDIALTLRVSALSPKRFLLPLKGGTKTSVLYLGDPYTAQVTATATSGAATLTVDQTFEFLASGHAVVSGQTIAYTGITATSLTGVTGITSTIAIGAVVQPSKIWNSSGHVTLIPTGADLGNNVLVSLNNGSGSYNFPGTPLILTATQIAAGVANALPVGLQVQVLPGPVQEIQGWAVSSSNFYARDSASVTAPANGENGTVARMYGYVYRQDQALKQWARVLPVSRQISKSSPGFIIGEYRWKDEDNSNAVPILPTKWDPDLTVIGPEKFTTGIGHGLDLEPVDVEASNASIYARINAGHYFTGPERNFLPSNPVLEFHPANSGSLSFTLAQIPQQTYPVYVGTYQLDSQGYYSHGTQYHYQATGFDVSSTAAPYQFTLNWKTGALVLNQPLLKSVVFLGTLSGKATDFFDMALYPVAQVNRVYIDRGSGSQPVACPSANISFNQSLGTIQLTDPAGIGPTIPTGLKGEAVFAECETAVAVLYSSGTSTNRLVSTVDLNPANSGISSGHFYLQHRRQKPNSIMLTVDKPILDIPPTPQLATRIQSSGGSNVLKYLFDAGLSVNGGKYTAGVLIKNQGLGAVTVNTQLGSQVIAAGSTKNVILQLTGNGSGNAQLRFETDLAASILDIVVFSPFITLNGVNLIPAGSQLFVTSWTAFGGATITITQTQAVPTLIPLVGQTAYGPVYFENDYALISATCFSKVPDETIPNARLQVIVDPTNFSGLINYVNPLTQTIQVVTGGDGIANLVYTPTSGFGVWLPTTTAPAITATSLGGLKTITLANDSIVLPATVPISQVRNNLEGWLITTYLVFNNNPLFGMTGADPALGEIAFQTTGTAGAVGYKTNGMRDAWRSGSLLVFPINAFDAGGNSYTSAAFNGNVKYLQFAASIPTGATIGSYFVSYLQRVTLQLSLVGSNVTSNTVILQMQVPSVIVENPWLIIQDSIQGRLNQYRLGWVKPTNISPTRAL